MRFTVSAATDGVRVQLPACAATYPPIMLSAGTISLFMVPVPIKKDPKRHNRFITKKLKKLGR